MKWLSPNALHSIPPGVPHGLMTDKFKDSYGYASLGEQFLNHFSLPLSRRLRASEVLYHCAVVMIKFCNHYLRAKSIVPTISAMLPLHISCQPFVASLTSTVIFNPTRRRRGGVLFVQRGVDRLAKCLSTNAFVIAADDTYGNKQVISLTPPLYDYILSNVREPEILRQLREETTNLHGSQMQVSPDQGQLLAMLVQILGARRCIEVGVYTGYSSLAVALVLPDSGFLVACERDANSLEVALRYYKEAGVLHKVVHPLHGLAKDALNSLLLNGEAGRSVFLVPLAVVISVAFANFFHAENSVDVSHCSHGASIDPFSVPCSTSCSYDFAFIDADKKMYGEYFELLLQLVRVGGLIIIDNVLWHGKVADPLVNDSKTMALREFNKTLLEDDRVDISMVPIGDGMTICRKKWQLERKRTRQAKGRLRSRNSSMGLRIFMRPDFRSQKSTLWAFSEISCKDESELLM
ncbi:putative caffeoyl-CoA O-methyltransferase [Drosera capensis]